MEEVITMLKSLDEDIVGSFPEDKLQLEYFAAVFKPGNFYSVPVDRGADAEPVDASDCNDLSLFQVIEQRSRQHKPKVVSTHLDADEEAEDDSGFRICVSFLEVWNKEDDGARFDHDPGSIVMRSDTCDGSQERRVPLASALRSTKTASLSPPRFPVSRISPA